MPYWMLVAGRPRHLPRLRRQVGAVPAARLAARRDGRPDAGQRPHPRRHDGGGRRLPRGPLSIRCSRRRRCWSSPTPAASRCSWRPRIAVVMTDIKKVLAYSTVSQLGYMMLALGVGGWVAGLFHLLTHAFFKALLFLCSGSVIYGCHHEQDMTKMGGLFPKMKITALTMLVGVLAIAGMPLFSGWYSKDAILAQAFGFVYVHPRACPAVPAAAGDGRPHDVLHVPHVVPDLHRQAARPSRLRARPRIAVADDGAADRAGGVQRLRRLGLAAVGRRRRASWRSKIARVAAGLRDRGLRPRRERPALEGRPAQGGGPQRAPFRPRTSAGWPATWRWASSVARHRLRRRCSTTTACSTRPRRRSSSRRVHALPGAQVVLRRAV